MQTTRNGDRNRVCRNRPTTGAHDRPSDAVLFAQHSLNDLPCALESGALIGAAVMLAVALTTGLAVAGPAPKAAAYSREGLPT